MLQAPWEGVFVQPGEGIVVDTGQFGEIISPSQPGNASIYPWRTKGGLGFFA